MEKKRAFPWKLNIQPNFKWLIVFYLFAKDAKTARFAKIYLGIIMKSIFKIFFLTISLSLSAKEIINCHIAIVGGGVGGLYSAYRLGSLYGSEVCLFEKEKELGGRIKDIPFDSQNPDSPRIGVGARRIMEKQNILFDLAKELNLSLETPLLGSDLIMAKGLSSFNKDDFASLYKGLPLSNDPGIDQETYLYDLLRKGPERSNINKYPNLKSYVEQVVSASGLNFLHDMTRFRADFEYPLDARSYMDYLDEEWDYCCIASYPIGGMSQFIKRMEKKASEFGVTIITDEPILSIHSKKLGYTLQSANYNINAAEVILAVPPVGLEKIRGDVSERIKKQKPFKDIIGIKVVTISQWWPYAWWKDIKNPKALDSAGVVWRGWTTDSCINFIEIPQEPYAAAQNVTRSVYNDGIKCTEYWEKLSQGGIEKVEAVIQKGLLKLFSHNGASTPEEIHIPKPLKTYVQIWPSAWHYLRAGATHTNQKIADWATNPLGEKVYLVGESYFPNRSGWSDGAFKSSIKLLNERFGFTLSDK